LAGTFHGRRSRLLKIGFFREVRELKIQRKNPGSALHVVDEAIFNTSISSYMMKWNNQTIVRTLHLQFLGYNEDYYGACTLDVKSTLIENLGGILGVTQCQMELNVT
jgi:hypothetical protein